MKILLSAAALLAVPVVTASGSAAQVAAPPTVFRGVSLLTMEDDEPRLGQAVVVQDGRIRWMGPVPELTLPSGATVVEGEGRFLLPGLSDMHVHMDREDIPLFLANGVTTVRELNGSDLHLALRDSITAGLRPGPRMFVASTLLAGAEQPWRHELLSSPDDARRLTLDAAARGFDALKVYDGLSREVYQALVMAGAEVGLPLVGHIPAEVGLAGVLQAGQRGIEHTEQIMYATIGHEPLPEQIPSIVRTIAASAVWVTPTLASQRNLALAGTPAYNARLAAPEVRFVAEDLRGWWASLAAPAGAPEPDPSDPRVLRREAFYGFQRDLARALHEAGVPLLAGTDAPNPLLVPGYSLHLELEAMREAGIPAIDVLRAATREAARFVGEEGDWGTLMVGAAADLLLVEANPLDDLSTLRNPVGVMARGTWLDAEALLRMIEAR